VIAGGAVERRRPSALAYCAVPAAALATLCFVRFGFGPRAWVAAYFAGVLVVLSAIDLERRILPNRIVLPSTVAVLLANVAIEPSRSPEWAAAALAAAAFLFLPLLVDPAGIGMGDVKLGLLLGAGLGKAVAVGLVLGFLAVFPVAVFILLRRGSVARRTTIPFGPFLAFGAVVALFIEGV
jgi:leader peptidase (prepilin peptidase) / N-methyltransferase